MGCNMKGIVFNVDKPEGKRKYPFDELHVGGTFLVKCDREETTSVRTAASQYGRRNGKKFSCAVCGDGIVVERTK